MRSVQNWSDLEQFGIKHLTGEACSYALRILCDVTESGKYLVEAFFGETIEIRRGSNWNSGNKDDPHVGSILLPRHILTELAAFCLLQTSDPESAIVHLTDSWGGCPTEVTKEDIQRLFSGMKEREMLDLWKSRCVTRFYSRPGDFKLR